MTRQITDAKYGQDGSLFGKAAFTASGQGLLYRETGTLTLKAGAQMQATRSYLWDADAAGITVRFDDAKPFHRFDLTETAQGTSHLCGADWYNVTYDFTAWPAWSTKWAVQGPRKDYTSITHYNRASMTQS